MFNKYLSKVGIILIILFTTSISGYAQLNLILPDNHAKCVSLNPQFRWNSIANLDYFTFYISENGDFPTESTWTSNVGKDTNRTFKSIFPINDLKVSTKYYWKVVAKLENTQTISSTVFDLITYTTPALPVYPYTFLCCLDTLIDFQIHSQYSKIDTLRVLVGYNRQYSQVVIDTLLKNINVTDGLATVKLKLPKYETTYYWTAMQNVSGCWADSLPDHTNSFCTRPIATNLVTPVDDSKGIPLFQNGLPFNVNLKWKKIQQAVAYVVTIADNINFANAKLYWALDTFITVTLPENLNQTYFWRVTGKTPPITLVGEDEYDTCSTVNSAIWKFKTPYGSINLVYPNENEKCVPIIFTASWDGDGTAGAYRLQIATSNTFADGSIVLDRPNITTTSSIVQLPTGITQYFWRVRAENNNNIGLWSVVRTFHSTAETPKDVNPKTGSTGVAKKVTLEWAPGKTGTAFQLQIFKDVDLEDKILDTLLNTNKFTYTFANFNTKYYWRVKGYFDNCQSELSPAYTLKTYIAPPFNLKPEHKSQGIEPFLVTFTWEGVPGTQTFDLELSTDSTFKSFFRFERNIAAKKVIYGDLAENKMYYWRVRGINNEGTSEWTTIHYLKTGYVRPDVPVQFSPEKGAKKLATKVTVCWQTANKAIEYHLQVSETPDFKTFIVDVNTIKDLCYEVEKLKVGTEYYWRIAAINLGGSSGFSPTWSFKTAPLPPSSKINLVNPSNNSSNLKLSVEFKWDAINGADLYNLLVSKDQDFKDILYNSDVYNSNSKTIHNLPPLTKLYWKVRGENDGGFSPWSDTWNFTTEDPKSVNELINSDFQIYPNPANEFLMINIANVNSAYQIDIKSMDGKSVLTHNNLTGNTQKIDVSYLPNGTYLVNIIIDSNSNIYKFFINR